jgi:CRISPR/Cas system-associated protein Cas10 (large subunit of type III CRISPR-Cas system)
MESFETLLVASPLHDVGKLWQRTGQRHSDR